MAELKPMKFPLWLKWLMWCLLLFSLILFLSIRLIKTQLFSCAPASVFDIVAIILLAALVLIVIFQEVDILGVKLKREIESVKNDLGEKIVNLKTDLQNIISIGGSQVGPFYLGDGDQISKDELEEMIRKVTGKRKSLRELPRVDQVEKKVVDKVLKDVPEDSKFLFSVRYAIEKQLNKLFGRYQTRPLSLRKRIEILFQFGVIDSYTHGALQDTVAIANRAIHGLHTSGSEVLFVKEVYRKLLDTLGSIEGKVVGSFEKEKKGEKSK